MTERARRARVAAVVAVAVGLSAWAAFTTPFSTGADAVTAVVLGLVATVVAVRWRRPAGRLVEAGPPTSTGPRRAPWWPWLALGAALLAWELVSLFLSPRVDHPTLSSLYDSATRWRTVKAAFFLGWVGMGVWLVRA